MKNIKTNYYITIIIIMIIIGTILIGYGFLLKNSITSDYNYEVEKNSNYEVLLKPNIFYLEEKLPPDKYYASKSINLYKINFKYLFKGDKKVNISYNYNIKANLIGTVENNSGEEKEIWNREFNLSNNIEDNILDKNEFEVTENIDIDYQYYNNLARSYEKEYGIIINSILKIYFNISYIINIDIPNEPITDSIELEIPLTDSVSEVNENYDKNISKQIILKKDNINLYKQIFIIISGIFIICSAIIIILVKIKNKKTPEEKYNKKLNQILKYYKDIIISVNNLPDIENLKPINVSYIEDLIDIAEQTKNNIIYYRVEEEQENNFYIISNNYIYIYKLRKED